MGLLSSVRHWTKAEEDLLFSTLNNLKGESKSQAFTRLAKKFGRTSKSLQMKYYKEQITKSTKSTKVIVSVSADSIKQNKNQEKERVYGRPPKFFWTEDKIEVLKEELLKVIRNNLTSDELLYQSTKRFKISRATAFNKIRKLKVATNSKTLLELHNALVIGVPLDLINNMRIAKKKNKGNKVGRPKQSVVVTPTKNSVKPQVSKPATVKPKKEIVVHNEVKDVAPQVVVAQKAEVVKQEKQSFFGALADMLLPHRRIKKLEQQIEDLKSNSKN
jgi:hypothetical protein